MCYDLMLYGSTYVHGNMNYHTVAIMRRGALQFGGAVTPGAYTRQTRIQGLVLVLKKSLETPISLPLIQNWRSFKTRCFIATVQSILIYMKYN